MSLISTRAQPLALLQPAQTHFGQLSPAELNLLAAAQAGGLAVCGVSPDLTHSSNNPEHAGGWGAARTIRAALIRWLCIDPAARDKVSFDGVLVVGAQIIGELNLSYTTVPFRLGLLASSFTHTSSLHSANLAELDLRGSWIYSLNADCIRVTRRVLLCHGFRANGEVRLPAAEIGIDLGGWPSLDPDEPPGWPILAGFARVGPVCAGSCVPHARGSRDA